MKKKQKTYIQKTVFYKTLINEIKDDTNRWRNIPCSWIRRIKSAKLEMKMEKSQQTTQKYKGS